MWWNWHCGGNDHGFHKTDIILFCTFVSGQIAKCFFKIKVFLVNSFSKSPQKCLFLWSLHALDSSYFVSSMPLLWLPLLYPRHSVHPASVSLTLYLHHLFLSLYPQLYLISLWLFCTQSFLHSPLPPFPLSACSHLSLSQHPPLFPSKTVGQHYITAQQICVSLQSHLKRA